jgi:hypothetical protein
MSSKAYRELCGSLLSPADAALLDLCALDPDPAVPGAAVSGGLKAADTRGPAYGEAPPPVPSDFINCWRNWERTLRLNLARHRAARIKREGGVEAPEYPADAAAAAKAAVSMDSPLEAELFLDKARWDAIEAFQGLNYFGRNTIYAYLLKLLLMERRSLLKTEEGFAEYKRLYTSILDDASQRNDLSGTAALTSVESGEPK